MVTMVMIWYLQEFARTRRQKAKHKEDKHEKGEYSIGYTVECSPYFRALCQELG